MISLLKQQIKTIFARFKARPFNTFITVLMLFATIGILGILVYRQRDMLIEYRWQLHPWAILGAAFFYVLTTFGVAVIWGDILNRLTRPIPMLRHYQYYCISNVAKRIPGTIWYIASRASSYAQDGVDVRVTSIAASMELAMNQMSGIIISLFFSLSILASYKVPLWALGLVFLGGLSLVHPRVVGWFFRKLKVEASAFRLQDIVKWTVGYIFLWPVGAMIMYCTTNIIYPLSFSHFGYMLGSWVLVSMLTYLMLFFPSNVGVTEVGLSLLFSQIMPSPVAVATAILARLLTTLLDILCAALMLFWRNRQSSPINPLTQKD